MNGLVENDSGSTLFDEIDNDFIICSLEESKTEGSLLVEFISWNSESKLILSWIKSDLTMVVLILISQNYVSILLIQESIVDIFLRIIGDNVVLLDSSVIRFRILNILEAFEKLGDFLQENWSDNLTWSKSSLSGNSDSISLFLLFIKKGLGSLLLRLASDELLSLGEFLIDISNVDSLAINPRVAQNFGNWGSVGWVRSKQSGQQVNQLVGEKSLSLIFLVGLPEFDLLSSAKTSVISASLLVSLAEGGMSSESNEENDSSSKQVNFDSVIRLLEDNFGCHISLSSENGSHFSRSVSSIQGSGEPKIGDLQVHILVEQEILWLEISMGDLLLVEVVQTFQQLEEVSSGNFVGESTDFNKVKQLTILAIFDDNSEHLIGISVFLDIIDFVENLN